MAKVRGVMKVVYKALVTATQVNVETAITATAGEKVVFLQSTASVLSTIDSGI